MEEKNQGGYIDGNEIEVSELDFLISRTDLDGNITYASDDFCRISGYSKDELKGSSHNIVRHEEMPKSVFENMWSTIKQSKKWTGIVKNRTKNRDFYWVFAEVTCFVKSGKIVGYKSVRKKATEEAISEAKALYQGVLKKEDVGIKEWKIPKELLERMNNLVDTYEISHEKLMDQMLKLISRKLSSVRKKPRF